MEFEKLLKLNIEQKKKILSNLIENDVSYWEKVSILMAMLDEEAATDLLDLIVKHKREEINLANKKYNLFLNSDEINDNMQSSYIFTMDKILNGSDDIKYISKALHINSEESIEEYAVWGGIPRYWELRSDYPDRKTAIEKLILDTKGILAEEPLRLLRDDLRETVQTSTILSIIGNGANKLSEIAARAGKNATQITESLSKLRELGYIRREIPFGENEKNSKKGIYKINDNLLSFYFRFISPYRSILELGRYDTVMKMIDAQFTQFVGQYWELLCRNFISGNVIDGVTYNLASSWWGKIFPNDCKEGKMIELDVVAESFDKKHILIGECKWTETENAERLIHDLSEKTKCLPFIKKEQKIHLVLFLKKRPLRQTGITYFLPEQIFENS